MLPGMAEEEWTEGEMVTKLPLPLLFHFSASEYLLQPSSGSSLSAGLK
jgi:hypothetical protein